MTFSSYLMSYTFPNITSYNWHSSTLHLPDYTSTDPCQDLTTAIASSITLKKIGKYTPHSLPMKDTNIIIFFQSQHPHRSWLSLGKRSQSSNGISYMQIIHVKMYCSALQSPLNAMNVSNGMDRSVKLCSMSVSRVFIHKLFLLIFISLCDDFFKKGKTCMEICIIYQWILLFSQNAELCAHFTQSAHWGGLYYT